MNDAPSEPEPHAGGRSGGAQDDLRRRISAALIGRSGVVAADAASSFPSGDAGRIDPEYARRAGALLVELLAVATRDGRVDPRNGMVADLHRLALERGLQTDALFSFAYLTERTALDELALDQAIGATTEPWPLVAQLVRRASFDLLGAFAERIQLEPSGAAIIDRLTTLYSRAVFDAALGKAVDRAVRFADPLSVILFDVDRLSAINRDHGYGVGDKVLERLGILVKAFFRQHDWVARYSEDAFAVILARTEGNDAAGLADRVRATVQERLEFFDHRTERSVRVTISGGVVNVVPRAGDVLDADRIVASAEAAVERAKQDGRNRVARADAYSRSS